MPAALAALLDKRKLAFASARLRAWWDGEEFDEAALAAALDAEPQPAAAGEAPANDSAAVEAALFAAPADPRLEALQLIWGAARLAPGDDADEAAVLARLANGEKPALALLGPGLAGPVQSFAAGGAMVTAFEWRAETRAALGDAGVAVEAFDLDVTPLPHDAFDGLISFDEFTYGYAPHLALQMAHAVKPRALAIADCYVGPPGNDLSHAFASAFAEPQVRPRAELEHAVSEAGFDIEAGEDLTERHLALARARFEAFTAKMSAEGRPDLHPGVARELVWESETWRVRLRMLARRRIERLRLVLRRRA